MKLSEEQSSTDKGLMGFPVSSSIRKPSDGQPFKDVLSSVVGQNPQGGSAGPKPMMMRKKMKKS